MQVRSIILVCLLTLASFFPAFADEIKIIKELKEGGKLILIRHSEAPGTGDPANFNINDCKTQRNLSSTGIEQAKRMGEFFTPVYIKRTKEFIEKLDKNKNYIFVAHHTTIQGLLDKFANSGEMIIVDRSYKFLGSFKVN
ncbi:MAG: histidine phosphatase family protein [Candidatus Fonsibacter ubiquis]|nr:histidine phosphatase family protein [Candidatus Fonsibacter ubiquis]